MCCFTIIKVLLLDVQKLYYGPKSNKKTLNLTCNCIMLFELRCGWICNFTGHILVSKKIIFNHAQTVV